ncbi:hypothetical protein PVK06_034390 [Gossypium arboreum]|uniref:Aminotransferase-like plant mobile domain-containing protein n=1 Tax=Gossypium arboreum TaxID=29729 RepID=A0ABR0NE10_GOSAR|nr:hypothetical protein PVK06_034390 [Gossypium arboreum]
MNRWGKYGNDWGEVHEAYIPMWNNRLGKVPQMDRVLDLQPSLEYIQWYCEIGKPFLFGRRSMVVPPHMSRIGQPLLDPHHTTKSEPEAEPELYSGDSSYHPSLGGDDYFPGLSGHKYHSEFDIFSPLPFPYSSHPSSYPPQYFAPFGPYSLPYSTPPGSSSSMVFETYDFSSMFRTPPHTDEENTDHRNRPQRECRAPQKYTSRTTPSNHQF